ncbi:protease pro-enzyme activation domain-containing protein [Kutzneria buriramensis]|uniref:Kumamolisin n=1 Tax=Kutzneria buriramensis TaxID=1045776 RepID=A0A3E0I6C9_9PSEU|nr:protease pro-enzyme activation domain-containing protein [Kutzneria buriramensis]REH54283.1 kumamolisin [Kutzneria buriramensis]
MKLTRRASVALLVAAPMVLGAGTGFAASAQADPHTTQLANSAAPGLEFATRTGSVDADQQMKVAVSLNYRDAAGLDAFLARVNNPSSAEYHHYLTSEQFVARFAPTQAQVDQVRAYLQGKGLTVTDVASNRMLIDASGPVKTVQSAFATSESRYHDNKTNKDFTANDTAPSVDSSVAGLIGGVTGLNNHYQMHSYTQAPKAGAPKVGSGPGGGYTAQELRSAYGVNSLVSGGTDGSGQSIAMLEFSHFTQSNISTYDQQYATGSPTPTVVKVDGGDDDTAGDGVTEVELDIEVAHAIAPKANVAVYEAPNSDQGEIDMWNKFVTDKVSVVSSSWGSCELDDTASTETAVDNVAKQGAAQGQTFLSAAGDSGAYDCYRHSGTQSPNANNLAVDFPGSDPYVTSVGGTSLSEGSGGSYAGETVWNEGSTKWAGGGGVSSKFARPSWQTGPGVSTSSLRQVPDVSANAQNYSIYTVGQWTYVGGTSAATPFWASVLTLANQQAVAAGHAKVGQVNSTLYQLGSSSSYGTLFHDITSGDNLHYSAAANFDEASGWGSPKADALVPNLSGGGTTQPGAPAVTNPGNQTNLVGDSVSITAKATGGTTPYTWSATGLPTGLSIASGTGVISGKTTTAGNYNVTVTATDAAGKAGSASFTWAVSTSGGSCSGQQLGNPGFETGSASPWSASSGVVSNASAGEAAHSGSYLAWLDGYGSTHTDTVSQSVTIPAGCHATLSFWLHIDTAETTTSTAYDKLTVKAGSTTLATYSNLNANSGYVQKTFDVSSLAGQTVTISFTGAEDSGLQTSFVIDDTAVTLS